MLCLLSSGNASAQQEINVNALQNISGVTVVYLSPTMIKNSNLEFTGANSDIPGLAQLMREVSYIYIYSSDILEQMRVLRKTFAPALEESNKLFERLFSYKDSDTSVYFVGRMKGNKAKNLYLIVDEPDNFVAIDLNGSFTRAQIEEAVKGTQGGKRQSQRNKSNRK